MGNTRKCRARENGGFFTRARLSRSLERLRIIWPLHVRHYGQFALSLEKKALTCRLYIFSKYNPPNKDTPFTRTLFMAPSGSVLTGFDCMFIVRVLLLTCFILPSSWLLHSRETRSKQYLLQTVEIRLSSSIMIS